MKNVYFLCFVFFIATLFGCTTQSTVQSGTYKFLYDYESREIHPEYLIYHHSDDSTTVFFRIKSKELLYARSGAKSPFVAKLNIRTSMSEVNGAISDSSSFFVTDLAKERQGWLIGSFTIKMPQGMWNVLFEFTDETKNLTQPSYFVADKTTTYSAQNYLAKKMENNEPVFGGFVSPGQYVELVSDRNKTSNSANLIHMGGEVKLPPPPFSNGIPEMPDLATAPSVELDKTESGMFAFQAETGNYFVTHDPLRKAGITIKIADTFFPSVKQVESLQWPLRYITTKTEHEEIVRNNYPKLMIDKFWLECAGNKEHARELIKIYYKRVEEANYYFSTFTEGWRTDRGMIHLIFGNPTKIMRFSDSETWQYGEDGTTGLLTFVFRKVESPLSRNVYVLDRDPGFKQYWERGVQSWRNGRVYND
jgi:GWxTD domain-containing protein